MLHAASPPLRMIRIFLIAHSFSDLLLIATRVMVQTMSKVEDTIRAEIAAIEHTQEELYRRKSELEAALRVLESGTATPPSVGARLSADEKKRLALSFLEDGPDNAKTPATVYNAFRDQGVFSVNVNNIRTILWRAAQRDEIGHARGRYWRLAEAGGGG